MSRLPIRLRVTAAFAVAMALVLAGSGWFLYDRLGSQLELALNRSLEQRSQDLAQVAGDRRITLDERARGRFIEEGERYAEVLDRGGRVLAATRPLGRAKLLTSAELRIARRRAVFADRKRVPGLDDPSRLLAAPVGRRILVVGETRQDRAETLSSFRDELLVAGPLALLLASLAGYVLAGLSLRQVESMRVRAAAISADTPGDRLPVPQTNDELQRLATTLNGMLERLEAGLERERAFVADAGHELRTPLTLLRTELELALRHAQTRDELRAAIRASAEEVDRLSQLAEHLLLIARTDRGQLPLRTENLDAGDLLESVATRFRWRADEARRSLIAVDGCGISIHGDPLRLEQALSNLVDNALRHGAGDVRLDASARDGIAELHVRDGGNGFPDGYLDHAFERFARGDAARGGTGTGLGLAIVQAIARAHGGDAHAANDPGGGADVWMSLPRASN